MTEKWRELRQDIPNVTRIEIPRWIGMTVTTQTQLHVFCDASKKAIGVAMYVRTIEEGQEKARVELMAAKSKVAPRQVMTIPRV